MKYFSRIVHDFDGVGDILPFGTKLILSCPELVDFAANLYKPIKAYGLACRYFWYEEFKEPVYVPLSARVSPHFISGVKVEEDCYWPVYSFDHKQTLFNALTLKGAVYHNNLKYFNDYVMLLGVCKVDPSIYCYCEYGDSLHFAVGRFKTKDSVEAVSKEFLLHATKASMLGEPKEIPAHCFNGWISYD